MRTPANILVVGTRLFSWVLGFMQLGCEDLESLIDSSRVKDSKIVYFVRKMTDCHIASNLFINFPHLFASPNCIYWPLSIRLYHRIDWLLFSCAIHFSSATYLFVLVTLFVLSVNQRSMYYRRGIDRSVIYCKVFLPAPSRRGIRPFGFFRSRFLDLKAVFRCSRQVGKRCVGKPTPKYRNPHSESEPARESREIDENEVSM